MLSVYRSEGGVWLWGQLKRNKLEFSLLLGFNSCQKRDRVRNLILGDSALGIPFSVLLQSQGKKKNYLRFGGVKKKKGSFHIQTRGAISPSVWGRRSLGDPPAFIPRFQSGPQIPSPSPSPRAREGRTWGGGASRRVVRRLDDLGKMATLQGGLLGPDPGALSPAQQEQLRNFKVGAPRTPASVEVQLL